MQPKVSIVIPCYNKEKYIHKMFDSIIAQKWDNIELIIIDDGSTDKTSEIISEYESKFLTRGFEVVIINQENCGVSRAVYEGLRRISGDFVCQPDADDELSPEYVSTMVSWLCEHPEYDWVVCDLLYVYEDREVYGSFFYTDFSKKLILSSLPISLLLKQVRDTVHEYMIRSNYVKRSKLVENYFCNKLGTQEPQIYLPLAVAGGKLKYIPKPLYRYYQNEHMISRRNNCNDVVKYNENYYENIIGTIKKLDVEQHIKNRFLIISQIAKYYITLYLADKLGDCDSSFKDELDENLLKFLKATNPATPYWTKKLLSDYRLFYTSVVDNVHSIKPIKLEAAFDRIIAWGALGKNAETILPYLSGTILEPTDLWDIAGDGTDVRHPDVNSLTDSDLVLVLPANKYAKGIFAELNSTGCVTLSYNEAMTYICSTKLPEFYDGSIVF